MWGCCSRAAISISRRNRSAPTAAASSGCSTLMATGRRCFRSSARNTVAMPPRPSSRSTVERWATWQSARRTQADMIDLTHRLERIAQLYPSPGIETQLDDLRELAAAVGDDAIQAAIATTILFAVMLVALGVGLWYNRRRLAQPFAHVVSALERVAAGPRKVVRELIGDAANVIQYSGGAAGPIRERLRLAGDAAGGGLALVPLRAQNILSGLLVALLERELGGDGRAVLEQAAPNLAIACERESAHRHTRRLAVELRHAAQRLEAQNAVLTTLNDKLEAQHQELTRLNAELDQAGRLKDQFLANVSHELRTPLNSVIGFSDLLLTEEAGGASLTAMQRDSLETIARNGRHLLQLINELLDISKIAAGRMDLKREPLVLEGQVHQRAARHLEDRGRAHGPEARALGARGTVPRGGRYRARPARRSPPPTRDRPPARALHGARRPHPRAAGPAEPALQRHQVHARRGADHARRRRGRRRPHRPRGGERYGDRDRRRRPSEAVPRVRAGRRIGEPALRRHGTGAGALQATRGAARRRDRRRGGARPGQYVLAHPSPGR